MKPCAFKNQTLLDHSKGSYKQAEKLISENYYKVVVKRLENVGISLSVDEVKEIIKDAVLLHDIGKAGEYYQEQFDDECNPIVESPSFIYHEVGSALFFYYDYNAKKEVRELLALAAINHLNAIRGIGDFGLNMPKDFKETMLRLEKYGSALLKKLKEEGVINKDVRVRNYKFEDFRDMLFAFSKRNLKAKHLKLYTLILAPVMVGDNLDSSLVRSSDKKTRFVKLLEGEISANSSL